MQLRSTPAVVRDNDNQIHIDGSRADQVRYQMDGLNLTDVAAGGLGSNIPIDSIESVDMNLANYSAEFGKSSRRCRQRPQPVYRR